MEGTQRREGQLYQGRLEEVKLELYFEGWSGVGLEEGKIAGVRPSKPVAHWHFFL